MGSLEALSMGLVAGLTPSPHSLFVAFASTQSRVRALGAMAGGVLGDLLIITLTGTLLAHMPERAQPLFSIVGQALILWMGYRIFSMPPPPASHRPQPQGPAFAAALLVQLLNPYPYIFWSGVFFPRAYKLPIFDAVLGAVLFLLMVHFTKYLVYVRLVGALSQTLRKALVRTAFAIFVSLYFYRQISGSIN